MDFAVPADNGVELKKGERRDKYLGLFREWKKKTVEHESDGNTNFPWSSRFSHQKFGKRTRGLGNKRTSGNHLNYNLVEIC